MRTDKQIKNIRVHIERLVLDGIDLPRHQRPELQAAVEAELTRLMTAGGLAPGRPRSRTMSRLRAGSIQLSSEGGPAHMGRQIAQAVYGGVKR